MLTRSDWLGTDWAEGSGSSPDAARKISLDTHETKQSSLLLQRKYKALVRMSHHPSRPPLRDLAFSAWRMLMCRVDAGVPEVKTMPKY